MSGASSEGKGRKASTGAKKNGYKAKFVNYRLTSEDLAHLDAMSFSEAQIVDFQSNCAEQGYKVSIKADTDEGHFTASLYDADSSSSFFEHSLTARGSDARNAWKALFYKHEIIFERTWVKEDKSLEDYG